MIQRRDWLRTRATIDPESLALIDAPADAQWSYGELDAAVAVLAGRLSSFGVRPGDRVGVLVPAGVPFVKLVFAAMRLGAVLVPFDTRLADPERAARCQLVDPAVLVATGTTVGDALAVARDTPVVLLDSDSGEDSPDTPTNEDSPSNEDSPPNKDSPPNEDSPNLPADGDAYELSSIDPSPFDSHCWQQDDPLCILFTSGTTGEPKAVVLTAGNVHASATASAFRLGVLPADRWLLCLPTYHMGGLAPIYRSTLYGTTVVLQPFDPTAVSRAIDTYDVSGISLVPTTLRRLLDADAPLAQLRFVLVGGARTPPALVERSLDRDVPLFPTYGMTETASQIATARPVDAAEDPTTVGRPLVCTTVSVCDADGEPLPRGAVGELVVAGPTVTPGYVGDEEATDRAFGPHGFHTGDVGYLASDGQVHVRGRLDDRLVTGGENVHPTEVERVLREHPDVNDVAVVGLDDAEWGQRVSALIVPVADGTLRADQIELFCGDRLADYKRPRTIGFAGELPRTTSGTVDRGAVRDRLATGETDGDGRDVR